MYSSYHGGGTEISKKKGTDIWTWTFLQFNDDQISDERMPTLSMDQIFHEVANGLEILDYVPIGGSKGCFSCVYTY